MNFTLARSQLISTLMIEVGNLHVVNRQVKCLLSQVFCLIAVVFRKSWIWDSGSRAFFRIGFVVGMVLCPMFWKFVIKGNDPISNWDVDVFFPRDDSTLTKLAIVSSKSKANLNM